MFALCLTVTSTHVVPHVPSQQDCQFWASWLLRYYGRGGSCSHGVCGKVVAAAVEVVVEVAVAVVAVVVVCYRDYKDHTRS